MTELVFKGKEFVYNHHLAVPYRPLVPVPEKGIGEPRLDGNLIIHGDNLHALKSLLPMYAGKVDCIIIDPPYNTGNEGWVYNDNVNSPMIKEWLGKEVGLDDALRHDKWCAMMWPRLRLLHELLAEDGSFWMFIDDNEVHRARAMLDEIFGEENFVCIICWVKRYTRSNNAKKFSSQKDYIILYRKSAEVDRFCEKRREETVNLYSNPDKDKRGAWITSSYVNPATKEERPNLYYEIIRPKDGKKIIHPTNAWKYSREEHEKHVKENRLWWGKDGLAEYPRLKIFLSESECVVPVDVWRWEETASTDSGTITLREIFSGKQVFNNPKPKEVIEKILELIRKPNALILDSFAGSGTTAHAVLEANKQDGGNRRFILVECEDYADEITAERVRRVIKGYEFTGTQKTELLRKKLTFSALRKADKLLREVEAIENLHSHEFDDIKKTVKDGELIVTGIRLVEERAEGLGGEFTYCEMGDPVELDSILTGKSLPSFEALGAVLFHMAAHRAADTAQFDAESGWLGETEEACFWLLYRPDLEWLKSNEAALTLSRAREIAARNPQKKHVVFAAARFVSRKLLAEENLPVEFAPLPYALYRIERE